MLSRAALGLPTFATFPDLVGNTHSKASADSLQSVYPDVGDVELFPGGNYFSANSTYSSNLLFQVQYFL